MDFFIFFILFSFIFLIPLVALAVGLKINWPLFLIPAAVGFAGLLTWSITNIDSTPVLPGIETEEGIEFVDNNVTYICPQGGVYNPIHGVCVIEHALGYEEVEPIIKEEEKGDEYVYESIIKEDGMETDEDVLIDNDDLLDFDISLDVSLE